MESFTATIYVGFREHYDGELHTLQEAESICQDYCDNVGFCVTIIPTTFVYTSGREPGCIIGLINYPRFPSTPGQIKDHALEIAGIFLKQFNQYRITVICTDETYMINKE